MPINFLFLYCIVRDYVNTHGMMTAVKNGTMPEQCETWYNHLNDEYKRAKTQMSAIQALFYISDKDLIKWHEIIKITMNPDNFDDDKAEKLLLEIRKQ